MSDTSSLFGVCSKKKLSRSQIVAIGRLQKDLYDLKKSPFADITAEPIDTNIFIWHGNLRGPTHSPFDGGVFHFQITFPQNYPSAPPTIEFLNQVPSPFIIAGSVCLNNMLENSTRKDSWSPIYSVQSVLAQLQTFLLDGLEVDDTPSTGHNISFSQKQTSQWKEVFENRDQNGEGTLTPSEIRELMLEVGERKPSEAELALHYKMLHLPKDQPIEFSTFLTILQRKREYRKVVETANRFTCLHPKCGHAPQVPSPPFNQITPEDCKLKEPIIDVIKEETLCYYTKKSFMLPDKATLGIGLRFQRNYRDGTLYKVESPFDLISLSAFRKLNVLQSADNVQNTTHWLPVYINEEHGQRAIHLAPNCLAVIFNGSHRDFKPEIALEILPKLFGGVVTEIANSNFCGVKRLEGLCYIHRLFLALTKRYPEIKTKAAEMITKFINDEHTQTKDVTPNLSDILSLLCILDDIDLNKIFSVVLHEVNIRNVVWILKKFPELDKSLPDPKIDQERIKKSFVASITAYQILLFHRYFLETVAHPSKMTVEQIEELYDSRCGKPTQAQVDGLLVEFKRIKALDSFDEVYIRLGLEAPSKEQLLNTLREAVSISTTRFYHGKRAIKVQTPDEFLKEKLRDFKDLDAYIDEKASEKLSEERGVRSFALKDDESLWKTLCFERFGLDTPVVLDEHLKNVDQPWKHSYVKLNLEDLLSKFNENPDLQRFYRILDLSASTLKEIQFTLVPVKNIKSNFHYLTSLLTRLWNLEKFTITKGEIFLGLKGCKALCKGLKNNQNSLRILDLHYSHFTPDCMEILEEGLLSSHGLISLNLEGNPLGSAGAESIAKVLRAHQGITHLNITKCGIDSAGAKELASSFYHNKSLKEVHLGKNSFGLGLGNILNMLAYHPTIERIFLPKVVIPSGKEMEDSFTKLFEVSTSLQYLNVYQTSVGKIITEAPLHGLSQNRSVTELDFSQSSLTQANVKFLGWALARNRNIVRIDLEQADIGTNGIRILSEGIYDSEKSIAHREKAKRVRKLNAQETEESLRPRGCSLVYLNLANNPSTIESPEESAALYRLVSLSTSLVELNLSRCGLGVIAGDALGNALKNHPALTILNLSRNTLGEHGVKKLCRGLQENSVLTSLDLSRNKAGGRGISAVANLITSSASCKIQTLNLFGNLLGIEGARFIATALQSNTTVTDLDLGCNGMRPKGVSAIASALRSNNTLKILRMKLNFINDRAAMELAKGIESQQSIQKLCLAGNRIKDSILSNVVSTLGQRSPPVVVDISELLIVTEKSRLQRTILCTPLPFAVTANVLKKLFYDFGCGAIVNLSIKPHATKVSWEKANYAFIEFAELESVQLALDVGASGKTKVGKAPFKVIQAQGTGPSKAKPEKRRT